MSAHTEGGVTQQAGPDAEVRSYLEGPGREVRLGLRVLSSIAVHELGAPGTMDDEPTQHACLRRSCHPHTAAFFCRYQSRGFGIAYINHYTGMPTGNVVAHVVEGRTTKLGVVRPGGLKGFSQAFYVCRFCIIPHHGSATSVGSERSLLLLYAHFPERCFCASCKALPCLSPPLAPA